MGDQGLVGDQGSGESSLFVTVGKRNKRRQNGKGEGHTLPPHWFPKEQDVEVRTGATIGTRRGVSGRGGGDVDQKRRANTKPERTYKYKNRGHLVGGEGHLTGGGDVPRGGPDQGTNLFLVKGVPREGDSR